MTSYQLDFAKHSTTSDIPKLQIIWDCIPLQLGRENKRFLFSVLRKSARAREYEGAIQWLCDAGLIYKSYQITTAKYPLKGYIDRNAFKIFLLDVGLLGAMANIPAEIIVEGNRLFDEYKGGFVENYVAQQLKTLKQIDLFYWKSSGKKAEVDFLCEFDNLICPLEVKSGINPKSKSLRSFDLQFNPQALSRTTLLNLKHDGKTCNYPLYSISLFPELFKHNL
jgi:predicted AAA+ superfamily ATPase